MNRGTEKHPICNNTVNLTVKKPINTGFTSHSSGLMIIKYHKDQLYLEVTLKTSNQLPLQEKHPIGTTRVKFKKCEFKSTSYMLESTSYEFESMGYEFESTSYEFKSTSYEFKSRNH